jgi:hypothetical protein
VFYHPQDAKRQSIRICDRQSQLRITGSFVLIVRGFMNNPVCINRASYLRLLLMVPVSGYLVTRIYWMLQRRYHRDQVTTTRNMSRLHQSDGLSILAGYTSVAAIAIASSALPMNSAANEQARDSQVKTEASPHGQTEAGDHPVAD